MNKILTALTVVLVIFAAGCATTDNVTRAEIESADFGTYPENFEALIKEYLYKNMIDPTSMLTEFTGQPYKGYCYAPVFVPPGQHFGYGVPFRLNGKNRLGGYVGWNAEVAYIRNGRVYKTWETFEDVVGPSHGPVFWVKPVNRLVPSDSKR